MCREMFGWLRKLLGDIFVTVRFSLIFAVAVVVFLIWESCFRQSSENAGKFSTGFGFPSALLRYVVKAAGFALTSSIARTNRSHRSRELVGRMTGGGLISGQDSFVTSSNLGRYSSSLARWRSKGDEKDNFILIGTAVTKIVLKTSGTGNGRRQKLWLVTQSSFGKMLRDKTTDTVYLISDKFRTTILDTL